MEWECDKMGMWGSTIYVRLISLQFLILATVGGSKVTFNPFGTGNFMSESMIDESMMPYPACTDLLELNQLLCHRATWTRGTRKFASHNMHQLKSQYFSTT